jgi:5-oxoprolinase (ATP-hydrolysing)
MSKVKFAIDRGGTFTDIYAVYNDEIYVEKLLSIDPDNYDDAPREGIRRILQKVHNTKIGSKEVDASNIEWIRMGTTVATNALLERKGEPTALIVTKGFKDVLQIGNQSREKIFDLRSTPYELLYSEVIEVDERVRPYKQSDINESLKPYISPNGEKFLLLKDLDKEAVKTSLQQIYDKGIRSLAVVLMHAYSFKDHETAIGEIAKGIGFRQISLSHEVMPVVKITTRGDTTIVDAYLTPHIQRYLKSFTNGFSDSINSSELLFMQSDGGLTSAKHFKGSNAILSGPAGGVVGYARSIYKLENIDVIGFDMGGTSTDVSRYGGEYELEFENECAGVKISAPQLRINTVAAGGGSRLFFRNGMFEVGPESSGAHPGPVCYKKNGYLSITDANLLLGRIQSEYFPHIFGTNGNEPLDLNATKKAFEVIQKKIDKEYKKLSLEEIALGFIKVANETMMRPMREISVMRGYDIKNHILACFGGAGAQHACAIAKELGIKKVFIHSHAGILSAYGIGAADIVLDSQQPLHAAYCGDSLKNAASLIKEIKNKHINNFNDKGYDSKKLQHITYLNLRYEGTDTSVMIKKPDNRDYLSALSRHYLKEFGFDHKNKPVLIDDVRVRSIYASDILNRAKLSTSSKAPKPKKTVECYFEEGYLKTPLYLIEELFSKDCIKGPAIIIQQNSTLLIEPECKATINEYGDIIIDISSIRCEQSKSYDPITLSIFSNLFMSIAEQMGRTLQKTSISVNIKERLDFSCALFDKEANLVANAPHIPVHLGAMSESIKSLIANTTDIKEGDVFVTNDPFFGGSHLPDITVITPLFIKNKLSFFVANRGHHADIGGITPGSMPPFSTSISEEGIRIKAFKLVESEQFKEDELKEIFRESRNINDNISDLKAQVAANKRGVELITELIDKHSLATVSSYMQYLQNAASSSVRSILKEIAQTNGTTLEAWDHLDNGSKIALKIEIDKENGKALFDFGRTSPMMHGNLNAPKAITTSAVLYALRCIVKSDIPLNQGCLEPITLHIPEGSLLNPTMDVGVVGGNVLTSQRIVDVIFKAFETCAASQGCMNNFTFGNKDFGYYETIAGGAGAGPSWSGRSAIQTHMTNTRITDAETMERRYPVMVKEFSIRKNSGGKGKFKGGDGVARKIEFLEDNINASILTERRVFAPYGLKGGKDAKKGENLLIKKDGKTIDLLGKNSIIVNRGDMISIKTPGGGGYCAI